MKAFKFDERIVESYEEFSRSFSKINAKDLYEAVDKEYGKKRFWPDALLSLNPRYLEDATVDDLVASGDLDEATGRIFRSGDAPLRFHKHQAQSIAKAKAKKSFVVTTGTGSGKSLCFFVPVVDSIVRALRVDKQRKTRAIIVYPMNALANSQMKEIDKFIGQSGLREDSKPIVKRYTGQESREERERIAANPPDILLTNYMMAEMLLTRQDEVDSQVIANAEGLEFIILDELHTYRGRQGADVAVLVRRIKNRCCVSAKKPICIGTSATMASEGSEADRAVEVAKVATRLFGSEIGPEAVIDESLKRATNDSRDREWAKSRLPDALANPLPEKLDDETLREHPLAVWVELALGLDDGRELKRRKPVSFQKAAEKLARDGGADVDLCRKHLENFLTRMSLPENKRGGSGAESFLAFKLHRFISGSGEVFTTLTDRPRKVLFEGQREDPGAPGNRLYPTRFCRECGQEYHIVIKSEENGPTIFLPRSIDDTPLEAGQDDDVAGYLCPVPDNADDFAFDGEVSGYPESWLENRDENIKLRQHRRSRRPTLYTITPDGQQIGGGRDFWFIPGKFAFCLRCKDETHKNMRERSKLAGLSGEGRSSATTLLVSSALEWMNTPESGVPDTKRKLLGFTDNRQDAALQSGHFNDFLFVSLLRGAILRAVNSAGDGGLAEDEFGLKVVRALGFTANNNDTRAHWMLTPSAAAVKREDAQRVLAKVLAHRVWVDLRRGWRYTNPNLSALKLLDFDFVGLADIASDGDRLMKVLPALGSRTVEDRANLVKTVLRAMVQGLAVDTESLDLTVLDGIAQRSRNLLRIPWAIDQKENLSGKSSLVPRSPGPKIGLREERIFVRAGLNSRIARNIISALGVRLGRNDYLKFLSGLLEVFGEEGLVESTELDGDIKGWRLTPSAIRIIPGPAASDESERKNLYFHNLYTSIAEDLTAGHSPYWEFEGREHTAQVSQKQREWREWRFRFEESDTQSLKNSEYKTEIEETGESDRFLPALFCSPTMELGVDISALNAVYLRNVPPTPANYAQRAGRAGRSGQAAVVVTYCAAGSPHDQYFFAKREHMVAGIVRPPAIDITNEELVRSHLHAVWLAETKRALSPNIPDILDLEAANYPLKEKIRIDIDDPELVSRARIRMRDVLEKILDADGGKKPSWMGNRENFVRDVAENAPTEFNNAFDRWRQLYKTAREQKSKADEQLEIVSLPAESKRSLRSTRRSAEEQIDLLEKGTVSNSSDFYTYRYLATEGFLPGYNFPRLPLYAFVPGEGKTSHFISRARFLAISEFGPRSLIYHEGRAYRVTKAKLPPEVRGRDGAALATKDIHICPNCGACHEEEVERCHGCDARMAGSLPIANTLRIDNVETAPAHRITANDEERVRQGFDIQTVFSWPRKDGRIQVAKAEFMCDETPLLTLQYANSTMISRLNKGLKRRQNRTVLGFNIDPQTGYWEKAGDDDKENALSPDAARPVRIVPIVRDHKNALLLRFKNPEAFDHGTLTTVQHALLRGIDIVHQLEEGEVLGEPLPTGKDRRAILVYEATEGGAGVLTRLMDDRDAVGEVARAALRLMHFMNIDEAISAGDGDLLKDTDDACARGCYRCLLSYFNQPDHEWIDRISDKAKQLLIDLARGQTVPEQRFQQDASSSPWLRAFDEVGIPPADARSVSFAGTAIEFAWSGHRVSATSRPIRSEMAEEASGKGWELVALPASPEEGGVPQRLVDLLRGET